MISLYPRSSVGTELLSQFPAQKAAKNLFEMGFSIGPTKKASKEPYLWRRLAHARIVPQYIPELFDNWAGIFVVVGSISRNLTILDCENKQVAMHHSAEFAKRGLRPWVVASGGAKSGQHFWWLSAEGELDNVPKNTFPGGEAEIWGRIHYCLCPPSIHPDTGALYEWAYRDGALPPRIPVTALDWIPVALAIKPRRRLESARDDPLSLLSRNNRSFVQYGAPEGTRNNRLFAAACDLAGNGFDFKAARGVLAPIAEQTGLSRCEIDATLHSAYSREREPSKKGRPTPFVPEWVKASSWAESHHWKGMEAIINRNGKYVRYAVSAATARTVFLACCERARCDGGGVFRAANREIAELAGVERMTAYRALMCLTADEYLVRCGYNSYKAGLYAFGATVSHNGTVPPLVTRYCPIPEHTGRLLRNMLGGKPPHDAFERGALGQNGERIWRLILVDPLRAVDIERRLFLGRTTVHRLSRKLAKFGLAKRVDFKWVGIHADAMHLDNVAAQCGTLGKAEHRKRKHDNERSLDVTMAILRRKRRLEGH